MTLNQAMLVVAIPALLVLAFVWVPNNWCRVLSAILFVVALSMQRMQSAAAVLLGGYDSTAARVALLAVIVLAGLKIALWLRPQPRPMRHIE